MIGTNACAGAHCAAVLVNKAGSTDADALIAASEGLEYSTATGIGTRTNRHVVKDIYLAECVDAAGKPVTTATGAALQGGMGLKKPCDAVCQLAGADEEHLVNEAGGYLPIRF